MSHAAPENYAIGLIVSVDKNNVRNQGEYQSSLKGLLGALEYGYTIASAVAVGSDIHYILTGFEPLPESFLTPETTII